MSLRRALLLPVIALVVGASPALAQNQPITSPQDARCRDEARDSVFSAPNPNRLSPFDLGAEIYHACMRRLGAERDTPAVRR